MTQIVPYSFSFENTRSPEASQLSVAPDVIHGVYMIVPPNYTFLPKKMMVWFAERDVVELVAHGISNKAGLSYILLEWHEAEIDRLFLDILCHEETAADYTVYVRDLEG